MAPTDGTAPTDEWPVGRLLEWTTDYLKRHGSQSARLDAEVLLACALSCERIDLYTEFNRVVEAPGRAKYRELVKRRAGGMPVAYLVGRREFYSLDFRVTPDVLIPRPETEHLVVELLDLHKRAASQDEPVEIADVGTGSGILAVCAAKMIRASRVTAIDISLRALAVAQQNAADHDVACRIEFHQGDLLSGTPAEPRFDYILSNPPYVAESEMETLAKEVRRHEPATALVAGPTGTEVVARLIPESAERLRDGGHLLIEISPMIEAAVHDLFAADESFENVRTIKDLARLARIVAAKRIQRS